MCTSGGRKAAQASLTPSRRGVSTSRRDSEFVGGRAAFNKKVSIGSSNMQAARNTAIERGTTYGSEGEEGYVPVGQYGGSYGSGEGQQVEFQHVERSAGVNKAGTLWQGGSGRQYQIGSTTRETGSFGSEGESAPRTEYFAGQGTRKYDGGSVVAKSGGVSIGSTEEEARATFKDFGLDFDKDEGRGAFYKSTIKANNLQRTDVTKSEGQKRKLNRIRAGGGPNAAAGNARKDAKKQGNLRINRAGVQGGQAGGGTSLS